MGGKDVAEIIIQNAPAAINLIGELVQWISLVALEKAEKLSDNEQLAASGPTFQDLVNDCASKSRTRFQQQFSYAYNGAASRPPLAPGTSKVVGQEEFFNAQANNVGALQSAVTAQVEDSVAEWAQGPFTNDLLSLLNVWVSGPTTDAWMAEAKTYTYNNDDDTKTFQIDIVWLYCVTEAPDPQDKDNLVNTLFLYSIGMAYEAESWMRRSRRLVPQSIPVVRIAFAYTTMVIGTATAAYIYSQRNQALKIDATVRVGPVSATVTVSSQNPNNVPQLGDPGIPYQWVLDALQTAGIATVSTTFGSANADEVAEIGLLSQWQASQ